MNLYVPDSYVEKVHELTFGIRPIEALRGRLMMRRVDVELEGYSHPPPKFQRHDSGRLSLLKQPGIQLPLSLKFTDPERHVVPRRIRYTDPPQSLRPAFFPGAASDVSETCTGLRGRVAMDGEPMPWVRVEARKGATTVGRAHGDDRGEFVLVLEPSPLYAFGDTPIAEGLRNITVKIFAPDDVLTEPPLEPATPATLDEVESGRALPPGYTEKTQRNITFELGRLGVGEPMFVLS